MNKNGTAAELDWSTASEINKDSFEVQHSLDGINFLAIDHVKGSGNTSSITSYSFVHKIHPLTKTIID